MSNAPLQLDAMRGVPENWDGYGAAAPVPDVIDLAHEFLAFIQAAQSRPNSAPFPIHVTPTRVGGVLIEWEDAKSQHELEINPDGGISFLHLSKNDGEIVTHKFLPMLTPLSIQDCSANAGMEKVVGAGEARASPEIPALE